MIHKKKLKRALKVLKRAKGAVFIIADGLRYPVSKKAIRQMFAEKLPATAVTRAALQVLGQRLAPMYMESLKIRTPMRFDRDYAPLHGHIPFQEHYESSTPTNQDLTTMEAPVREAAGAD